ncbi:MAG TPA: RsmE family RNA methyltransferase [Acidimicrobiia bacterium]|nr:RsmE family RNA methyltransferase [Acidimicrobiia bacterium]
MPGAADELRHAAAHQLVEHLDVPALDGDDHHHLFRVLRLGEGERVTVTDGAGSWRPCRVSGDALVPDGEVAFVERGDPVTIGFAIPKSDRPDWIVQKLTELGVDRIVLLHAERSVVRWDGPRAERHLDKLRKVAAGALQQSRNVWMPELIGPVPAITMLPGAAVAEPGGRALRADDRTLMIGPEGGWSPEELAAASDSVALGGAVLRTETAAVAAGALLAHSRLGATK